MSIAFKCGGCGRPMSVREDMVGKKIRCKACSAITQVPPPNAEARTPAAETLLQTPMAPVILTDAVKAPASSPAAPVSAPPLSAPAPAGAPVAAGADRLKPGIVLPPKPLADVTINFKCSGCSRPMSVRGDLGGKKIRCKGCGGITTVPLSAAAGAEPAAKPAGPASPSAAPKAPAVVASVPPVADADALPVAAYAPMVEAVSAASIPAPEVSPPAATASAVGNVELAALRGRAEQAEQAIHSMAGQHALEKIGLTNRVLALEAQVRELEAKLKGGPAAGVTDETRRKIVEGLDRLVAEQDKALRAQVDEMRKLVAPPA